jgi:hypothetical protein
LQQDVAHACARRHANADLAGALDDADEHNIHHADSAHEQGNRRHGAEEQSKSVLSFHSRLKKRRHIADTEIFGLVALAQ